MIVKIVERAFFPFSPLWSFHMADGYILRSLIDDDWKKM
jgi:hypothetical protein